MSSYQPGRCNIGATERRRRYALAVVAFAVGVGYVVFVALRGWPAPVVIGVFVPLTAAFEWLVQARAAFCVRFALDGRYDFTGSGGDTGTVRNAAYRRRDRLQAAKITAVAILAAAALTALAYGGLAMLG